MRDPNCLFCKIIDKHIPAHVIYEDEHTLAFLDITPRSPGHTLVISKHHAPALVGLPDAEVGPLFLAVRRADEILVKGLSPDGITIGVNQGRASGQEVDHLHVHLMPRWKNDGGSSVQGVVHNASKDSVEDVRKKLVSG